MSHSSSREVRVGVFVLLGLAGLIGVLVMAMGGPAFLAKRRTVDVIFRDGQGVRVGTSVRVAGIESGRVEAINLAEVDGKLCARLRLGLPAELASRLKVDAKITIQSSLTGQGCVNIVSAGKSAVALVPGQTIPGVETSMFDPIMEQVGLGPVERNHLSHTIAEVRETVDTVGPRLRNILGSLQETAVGLRETSDKVRPTVEATAGHMRGLTQRLDEAKLEQTLQRLNAITAQVESLLSENRPVAQETLIAVRGLATQLNQMIADDRPKVDAMLDGLNGTRVRLDQVLEQTRVITGQGSEIITRNRAGLERIIANSKDATDFVSKLTQKLYGNPFYLSPLYKPTRADVQAQEFYDVANSFMLGAKELNDALKLLQGLQANAKTPQERAAYDELFKQAWKINEGMKGTASRLAEGIQTSTPTRR